MMADSEAVAARLTDVPHVEPPLPSDWEPRPMYPIHHIPYHVAQYWDHGLREQVEDKKNMARKRKTLGEGKGRVPRDLRETIKKTPGIKGWVRTLEGPVRQFLVDQGEAQEAKDESDFSDEEIVFVGRKAPPRDQWKTAHREAHDRAVDRGMIYDSLEDDDSSAFKYVLVVWTCYAQLLHLQLTDCVTGDSSHIRYPAITAWSPAQ